MMAQDEQGEKPAEARAEHDAAEEWAQYLLRIGVSGAITEHDLNLARAYLERVVTPGATDVGAALTAGELEAKIAAMYRAGQDHAVFEAIVARDAALIDRLRQQAVEKERLLVAAELEAIEAGDRAEQAEAQAAEWRKIAEDWSKAADDAQQMRAALEGVLRVADRKTVEFDAARAALATPPS